MPVYSGLELTDVIKGDPQVRGMTVIMLTGRSAQADRDAGARSLAFFTWASRYPMRY
jgi:CheY-like chemotaxis protein